MFTGRVLGYVQAARLPEGTLLERQPRLRRGLAHVLGGPGGHPEEGIRVRVNDTPEVDGKFVAHTLARCLTAPVPHKIRFWIKVNQGIDNDLVRIAIDGVDLGQCFTTWENYYRTAPEQAPPPNRNTPATINSLQFRSSVAGAPCPHR